MILRLLAASCSISIAACAPIWFPTNEPLPYSQGKYSKIYISNTPEEVVERLGQPHIKLQGNSLWVYGRTRAGATDGLGSYKHDYQAILIQFSEGKLASKGLARSEYTSLPYCWSDGICLVPTWDSRSGSRDEPRILSRRYSAVTSTREDDVQAKTYKPDDGQCAVYVYSGWNFFRDSIPPVVSIGTARDEPVPSSGYIRFQSSPKQLPLKAGRSTANIDCQAGSLHFYQLDKYMGTDRDNIHVKSISLDEGRKAVNERKLLLTW